MHDACWEVTLYRCYYKCFYFDGLQMQQTFALFCDFSSRVFFFLACFFFSEESLLLGAGGDVYTEGKVAGWNRRRTDVCRMYKVIVWQRSKDGGATQLPAAPTTPQQWREKTLQRHLCVKDKYIHSYIAPGHWPCVCTCKCVCLFV